MKVGKDRLVGALLLVLPVLLVTGASAADYDTRSGGYTGRTTTSSRAGGSTSRSTTTPSYYGNQSRSYPPQSQYRSSAAPSATGRTTTGVPSRGIAAARPLVPSSAIPRRDSTPAPRTATPPSGQNALSPAATSVERGTTAPAESEAAVDQSSVPSPQEALRLLPVHKGVDISFPTEQEAARCRVTARKIGGGIGWVVEDPVGLKLRKFIDTNGDNKVDQWCYYREGLEVYRDIDSDFNGKADQYRWFNTAGSRWGMDRNEDGTVDSWQAISAEEVTAEVIAAVAAQDSPRFTRVALSIEELDSLGLGPARAQQVADKLRGMALKFKELANQRKVITEKTKWSHFSGAQPGVVPAGTESSTRDLMVYENVVAIVQTEGQHNQVQIGTLVKLGEAWKVIDAPEPIAEGQADLATAGLFFQAAPSNRPQTASGAPSEKSLAMLSDLEKLDGAAARATTPEEQARVNSQRADLLEKMADEATKADDRAMWLRQLADVMSAAVQSGTFPGGETRLESLLEKVQRNQDQQLIAYVRFRQLTADYGLALQAKGADFAKIQGDWLKKLEQYVTDYPKSPDAAEAMLQLGIGQEFAGQEEEAKKWYSQIVASFPESPLAQKAAGAKRRLESIGTPLTFQGKSLHGDVIDLAKYRGQVVLIQYWASWCEPCKADMAILKELMSKHGRDFAVIGVNLDNSEQAVKDFLSDHRLPWPQIFEPGGRDSRPAVELGVLTLPTMLLIDQEGKVVNRNITAMELESELKRLLH